MVNTLQQSERFCADLARREAKNFYWSFRLLPADRRQSMCSLYAYMRKTDDIADEVAPVDQKRTDLEHWRINLDKAIADGSDSWPGFPALADTVKKHAIPPRYLHEVIDGVQMDLEPRPFHNFAELRAYCYLVASAVGLACIHIWGYDSQSGRAERLAESCGIALQLTNIIRDVSEDAGNGRVYLPQEDLERFGLSTEDLGSRANTEKLRELLKFQAERAYQYYEEAMPLVGLVSRTGRPVLRAIIGIYRALLDEIVRRDYDVFSSRVSLPAWKKAAITLGSIWPR